MEDRHLFFTLRMIWNHSAPEEIRIDPYRKYRFVHSIYTPEYMGLAAKIMHQELMKRRNLEPYYERCLEFMKSNFLKWSKNYALLSRNNHAQLPGR